MREIAQAKHIDMFSKIVTTLEEEPQACPIGLASEGGFLIQRDDSSIGLLPTF